MRQHLRVPGCVFRSGGVRATNPTYACLARPAQRTAPFVLRMVECSLYSLPRSVNARFSKVRTIPIALSFCIETFRKQDLPVLQVNDRDVSPFIGRSRPSGPCPPCGYDQFAWRYWRFSYTWQEHILKGPGSTFICKFASVNIRVSVEPTVHPTTCLVQRKRNVVR
jgi:hypothetical protein